MKLVICEKLMSKYFHYFRKLKFKLYGKKNKKSSFQKIQYYVDFLTESSVTNNRECLEMLYNSD